MFNLGTTLRTDLPPNEVAIDPRWQAAERVANSEGFRRSPRLRKFLLFVAEQKLNGCEDQITEHNVALRVYDRRETYDPTEDNIVRVSARQLRIKLREYYESLGASDPWIIEIPKGGYVPHFREKDLPLVAHPDIEPSIEKRDKKAIRRNWAAIFLIAVAATAIGWLIPHPSHRSVAFQSAKSNSSSNLITTLFGNSEGRLRVVVSDSSFSVLESILGHKIPLAEYVTQNYSHTQATPLNNPEARKAWNDLIGGQFVNLGDIEATMRIQSLLDTPGKTATVIMHSAQGMRPRDFRSGNFILLGSSYSDPWVQLFADNKFSFQFVRNPLNGDLSITDLHPKPGAPFLYSGTSRVGYARIALVPNLTNTGSVLLIAGTSMESTESAANFCLDHQSSQALLSALHARSPNQPIPYFEALLRTYQEGGTGLKADLLMTRMLRYESP